MSDDRNPDVTTGAEQWQLDDEAAAPASPFDDPAALIRHFDEMAVSPQISVTRSSQLIYARTTRRVLASLTEAQLVRHRAVRGMLDNPDALLWHFAVNSRNGALVVPRAYWVQYSAPLSRLVDAAPRAG